MEKLRDVFISHNSEDSQVAQALYDLLKSRDPDLDIFLDCSPERPLEPSEEWEDKMLREAGNSRYLIFLASRERFLEQGQGWIYPEVHSFAVKNQDRKRVGRIDRTIGWFGILLDGCPFPAQLLEDAVHGEQYRLMYSDKQMLCLQKGEGVESAAQRIWDKFCTMVEGGGNAVAAELLDKVHAFAEKKQQADPMFCPEAICEELLPCLFRKAEKSAQELQEQAEAQSNGQVDFSGLLQLTATDPVVVLGSEGGSGKTSLLTKLFYGYLPSLEDVSFFVQPGGLIPVYVDAKTLAGKNHLILRNLAKTLYDEADAGESEYISETVSRLGAEFARDTATPRYLLLIDGYNEIAASVLKEFDEELAEYLPGGRYQNVRLVMASRHLPSELPEQVQQLRIGRLSKQQVLNYLRSRGLFRGKLPAKLMEILSTPMYLKLYGQTAVGEGIDSKGDLLAAFVRWQQEKDQKTARTKDRKALAQLLLRHFLPLLSYRLATEAAADSAYVFSKTTLRQVSEEAMELLSSEAYGDYYGDAYWDLLDTSGVEELQRRKLADLAAEYFVKNSKLLRQEEDGSFLFVHQIYRDFFCAWFVAEELKRMANAQSPSRLLKQGSLPEDVREFVAELLQETAPVCTPDTWKWDYRCNESSVLYRLLCLARTAPEGQDRKYVANLLELLKYARGNDLSGCDFSGMDLRGCDLRTCTLSRQDGTGSYPANFAGAWLDRENLICDSHFAPIVDGCVGNGRVASVDRSGTIRIRVLPNIDGVTEKIITGVDPRVQKLLFAPEGDRLYAMTPHEILELPIPEERESVAQPRLLLQTTKRLRSIGLDENGQLCFTTVFNAFNPKPVSDPNAPDVRDFYGLNSVAAVNSTGTQLAFGHTADAHEALRIYDYDPREEQWVEKKFGYYLLMDGFIEDLVGTLKELSLYEYFPDDFAQARQAGEQVPAIGSFFEFIRREFYDRNHDYQDAPGIILSRVYRTLRSKEVLLPQHRERLDALIEVWSQRIQHAQQENPLLMNLAGRHIESVAYKGEDTLLVSCVNTHPSPSNRYLTVTKSLLVEINTRTMKTRFVSYYAVTDKLRCPLKAEYYPEGMLIFSNHLLTLRDPRDELIARVETYDAEVHRFLPMEPEGFLAICRHIIYQFDPMGRCVAGWSSAFEPTNCRYVLDEAGRDYLMLTKQLDRCKEGKPVMMLDLSTGSYQMLTGPVTPGSKTANSVRIGNRLYRVCAGVLTAFERGSKVDGVVVPYKLFVKDCDFRGVRGSIANETDLRQLFRFGAITDPVTLPTWQPKPEFLRYKVPEKAFVPSGSTGEMPFLCHPEFGGVVRDRYAPLPGGENLSGLKLWGRIYEDSYSADALEAADLSILEWTGRLGIVTAEMILLLIRAGMVEPPVGYAATEDAIAQRLEKVLHGYYRLLRRYRFCREAQELPVTWYALSVTFGVPLVRRTGGVARKPDADSDYALRRQLIVNQWFCRMAAAYPGKITRTAFYENFSSESHWFTNSQIHSFLLVGKQPLMVLATRRPFDEKREEKTRGTLESLCWLTSHYKQLVHHDLPEPLEQAPAIVILGEDYAHCLHLQGLLKDVAPFVRKLYTYDALLHGQDSAPPVHFSFQRGQAFEENILELI